MLDVFALSAIDAALRSKSPSVAAPEPFATAFGKAQRPFFPFITVSQINITSIDCIILHKGLLHKLGAPLVGHVHRTWTPTFANEVYVVYARDTQPVSGQERSEIERHLGPIEEFLRRPHPTPRPGAPKRATIVSAYGVGNIGDDLVSLASKKMLEDVGIEEVRLTGPSATLEDIEWADVVALGGGGLLYDWNFENVSNYLWPLEEAKRQGKPAVALGVGTQGITTDAGRVAYARVLPRIDLVSVRSPHDRDVLQHLGVDQHRLVVGCDMGFHLAPALRSQRVEQDRPPTALFSLSRVPTPGVPYDDLVRETIESLQRAGNRVILAVHSDNDKDTFHDFAKEYGLDVVITAELGIEGTAALYGSAKLAVTTRFHGLVYSAIMATPVVALFSDTTKNGGLLKSYLRSLLPTSEFRPTFSLPSFLAKIDNARAADPAEVDACIAGTMRIKERVAEVLGFTPVR